MRIMVNERAIDTVEDTTLFGLRDAYKSDADIMILNGAQVIADTKLKSGDSAVFIKRGEVPDRKELEGFMVARHTPGVHAKVKGAVVGIAAHHQANMVLRLLLGEAGV